MELAGMEKPDRNDDGARTIRKLTLPDGFRVGILNLDSILKAVSDLKLPDSMAIRTELLKRVKTCNYVASGAENEYAEALFREYQRKYGEPAAAKDLPKTETHQHTKG
jgi:hypothetical protein